MDSPPHTACSYDEYGGCGHKLANCHVPGRGYAFAPESKSRILTKRYHLEGRFMAMFSEGLCPVCEARKVARTERRLPAGTVG